MTTFYYRLMSLNPRFCCCWFFSSHISHPWICWFCSFIILIVCGFGLGMRVKPLFSSWSSLSFAEPYSMNLLGLDGIRKAVGSRRQQVQRKRGNTHKYRGVNLLHSTCFNFPYVPPLWFGSSRTFEVFWYQSACRSKNAFQTQCWMPDNSLQNIESFQEWLVWVL